MLITINNEHHQTNTSQTLAHLLTELKMQPKGIAVAVNNEVVPKDKWQEYILAEQDKVTIIKATQGG